MKLSIFDLIASKWDRLSLNLPSIIAVNLSRSPFPRFLLRSLVSDLLPLLTISSSSLFSSVSFCAKMVKATWKTIRAERCS